MRKQSAVDRGRNKPRSVSVSASWRSVATLFSRPTKPLRFTPLASNHRSTDTGSVGPASIANTIASTTDSRGAPCSALRLWNSHKYRALCLQVQIFVGKDKSFRAGHPGCVPRPTSHPRRREAAAAAVGRADTRNVVAFGLPLNDAFRPLKWRCPTILLAEIIVW